MKAAYLQGDLRGWSCFVLICLAWTLDGRTTDQETERIKLELRIPAQSLDEALQELARQSGMQVIYFSGLTQGIQSVGVSGSYTVGEALQVMLAGSGLSFRMLNARTVAIRKADAGELPQ